MLQFYLGLYGLALFLCFLGLLFALTEKAWKWYKKRFSSVLQITTQSTSSTTNKYLIEKSENQLDYTKANNTAEVSMEKTLHRGSENNVNPPNFSEEIEKMGITVNENSLEEKKPNGIKSPVDTSTKSWSERRQERRKRYKEKKVKSSPTSGYFSNYSSVDECETTITNDANSPFDDSDTAPTITHRINNDLVISDNSDGQPEYYILDTHNMCEQRNSIQVTNLDDVDNNITNSMVNSDSLDDLLEKNAQFCKEISELGLADWILLLPKEEEEEPVKQEPENLKPKSSKMKADQVNENEETNSNVAGVKGKPDTNLKSTSDAPVSKSRRVSLRSKRSFDYSFELWDESYFAVERKISQLEGLHYAAFNTNKQNRPNGHELIDLIEDQGVTCLDADNPDKWVVRAHRSLQKMGSFQRELKKENTSNEFQSIDENESNEFLESSESVKQEFQINNEETKRIGRVPAVCLTRHLKSAQRGKRNPREAFREDVISFSNKQQEARMKMRYALTELSDTEIEYSRALKQLVEVFDSLNGKMIVSQSESSEQTTDYPQMIKNDIEGLKTTLRNILQFSGMFLEKLPLYALEPGKSAECFTKNPDRWYDYTMFLLHLDNLINHTSEIASQDTEISFSLTVPDSLKTKQTSPTDQTDSYPQPYQRNSVSLRNILDLTDVPRNRLNAYCGLLRDIARYIARDGSSTKNLELAMTYVTRSQRRAEEFAHFWSRVDADFSQIFSSENLYEDKSLFGKIIPPPITRMTDIKIGEHKNVRIDAGEMKTERLILMPDHLLSAKCFSADQPSFKWKLSRIINLDEVRLGDYGNDGKDQTSFELWNISGEDPLKLILHITCPDVISRNAWVEDIRNAIREKTECCIESTNVDKSVVDSHIKAFWDLQKRYTGIMELSPCRSESVSEIYFDALENVQQVNSQNVESSQFSQIDKDVLVRTSINQKSTSSSSYYTADEPMDDKDRATSGNLFESYSTLDGVQTPFSEDQQSLADFQMSPDVRGNQSQLLPRSSLTGSETLIKQLTVNAGEQIQFNASFTISGPVAYETSWFMNGAPMKPDLGADMILSDRDTRLLISNADPLVHSGTYACRCRLFEGTETAVYFCVNVLTAKMNLNDSNENESDQARRMSLSQPKIFYPVTKDLDIAVGKPLTIEVKIDEENALKLMNNSKENVQVDWYQDSTLLKSTPTCEMIKSNDRFFLHSTTSHLQPDKIYMYTCMLRLPANSSISPAPSLTIPVRCHYPTAEELEKEFKTSTQSNTSESYGIITHPVALPRNEPFQLSVPVQNDSENHDYVIWWTRNDKLLAGSHLPTKDCVYECVSEPKRDKNQTLVKLLKSSTKDNDSGTYKCWAVSQSIKNHKIHRIDVTVKVNEEEKDLNEKKYEEEREKDEKEFEVNEETVIEDDTETESPVQQDNKRIDDREENIKQPNEKSNNAHFPETELQLQHNDNEKGKETVEIKEKKDGTQKVIIEFQKIDSGNQNEGEYEKAEEKNSSVEKTSEQIIQIQEKTLEKKTADTISVDNNEFSDNREELSNVELCFKEKLKDGKRQKPEEENSRDVDSECKLQEEKYKIGEKEKSGVQVPEVLPKSENEIIMNQLGDEDKTKNKQEDETRHRPEDNYAKTELTQTTEKEHDTKNKDITEEENSANSAYEKKKASLKEVEFMQQIECKENQEYCLTSQNSNVEDKSSLKQPEDKMIIKTETKTIDEVDTELPPLGNKDITTNLTTTPDEKQIKSNKSKRKSVGHGADKTENLANKVKVDEKQKILEESVVSKDAQEKPITADSATDKTEQTDNKHMKTDKSKRRSSKYADEASDVKKGEETEQVDDKKRKHKAKEKAVSENKVDTDESKKQLPVDSNAEPVDKVKEQSEVKTKQEVNQKRKGSEHAVDTDESKNQLPVDSNAESVDKVKEQSEVKTKQEVNQKRKGSEHAVDTDESKNQLPVDSNTEPVDKVKEQSEVKTKQEVNQKRKGSEHAVDTDESKKQLPVDSNAESVDKVKEQTEVKTKQEVNQKRKGSEHAVDTDESKKQLPVDSNAEPVDKVKEQSEVKTKQEVNQKRKGSEHAVDTDESKKQLPVDSNAESVDKVKEQTEVKTKQEVNQKRKGSEHAVDTDESKKQLPVDSNAEPVDKVKEQSEVKTKQEVNQKRKGSEHAVDTDESKKQLPVDSNAESVDKVKEQTEVKTKQEVNQKRKGSEHAVDTDESKKQLPVDSNAEPVDKVKEQSEVKTKQEVNQKRKGSEHAVDTDESKKQLPVDSNAESVDKVKEQTEVKTKQEVNQKRKGSEHAVDTDESKKQLPVDSNTEPVDKVKEQSEVKTKQEVNQNRKGSEHAVDTDESKKQLPVDSNTESVDKVKEQSEVKTKQEVNQKRKGSEHAVDTDESKKQLPVDSNAEPVDKVKEQSEVKTKQEVNQKRKGSEHAVDTDESKKQLPVDSNAEPVDKVKEQSEVKTKQEVNQKRKGSEHAVDTDESKNQLPVDSNAEPVDKVKEQSEIKTKQEVNHRRKGSDIQKTENDLMMEKSVSDTLMTHGPNIVEDKTSSSEVTLDNEKAKKEFKASDTEKKEAQNSDSTMNHEIFDAKTSAEVDQARDLAFKEQDAMEEKKKKKEKSKKSSKQKDTERKLSKDTIKLDSDIGKTFTPLNEQNDDTTLLNEYQQDKQPRKKHRKSVVKTENDDSGNKNKMLDDQKEYTDITEKKLVLDYEKGGDEIRNLLESQEVKESYMKNQEMEIPTDLHDEDRIRRSNVVFLKPVSDISKGESMSVKQGATVNLTTELDISGSSVLHPDDFITLKNGKPIEFNEKETPILTIKDNLINLVLEEISPEQGGIYEIGLRQPTKCLLKSGENEDETLDEPTSSSVIPFARFPLICVEPNESLSKDYTIKQIQDEYKQPKIFVAELLPKYVCMQGETMKLAVELKSNVCVKDFEWSVNGKTIDPESSTDFVVWQTGNWIALTIPNVRADLTGTYTLTVDTPRGRYTTTSDLSVNGQKRQTTPYVPSQVEGLKPLFTKKLQDYTAEANEIVRLCARLVAEPPATITWKHNGIPIKDDNRIKIYQDHVNPSITIQNVKDEDYGEYSCVATNVLGQTETKATLYIQNNFFEPVGHTNDENKDSECIAEPTRSSALPSRVNNLQLVDVYEEGFKISWDPILDEQVTYNVEISNDAGRWWKPVLTNLHDVSADISNDMACPLNPVQIRIVAENEYGLGPPCFPFIRLPIRACLPHMQAIKPETEFEEATAVRLRWAPAVPSLSPSQMNKSGMLDKSHLLGKVTYSVEIREGSQSEWHRVASDISGLSYTYHLKPGVSSAIRIVAKNKYGESSPTPMTIVQLDPDSLIPDLSLDSPWVAVNYPADNVQGKRPNVKLFWKAAYMPEFCDSCIKGLKPFYRIEWRRGKSGPWLELARDIKEYESGYPLPKDIVDSLINETKSTPDLLLNNISLNHSVEFRVVCYNEFGESGPTKSYRLKASQLFRGQGYRNNLQSVDTSNGMDQYEHLSVLDKLPVISSAKVPKLEVQVTSVDPKEGIALKWAPCTNSYLSNGVDNNHDSHGRYRIQRMLPSSISDSTSLDVRNWTVVCKEDGLIYGEEYVLDIRPSKMEQFVRILTLNEDSEGNHTWLDNHEILRIPALYEICPPAPSGIEVKLLPPNETSGCTGVCVSWKPPNHELISDNNYLKHVKNYNQIDYRIEVRTTLSEMAPWRQVGLVSGLLGKIEDRKAEPGSQLIYRITPINQFGEGPSLCSSPVRLPLLLTSLERCIEDLRFLILGPSTIQLRWRLGDSVIDALGFKKDEKQSKNITKQLDFDESAEMCERVNFSVERRDGYAGEWYPIYEQIKGNLLNKILLNNFSYLDKDISCRIIAYVDGQQTKPSRPISISIKTDYLVPDFSAFKPHVNVTSVEEYVITWEDPDVQSLYTSHILNLTMPQVLHKDTSYSIQIQQEGSTDWKTIASDLLTTQWTWSKPNPLMGYHIRVQPFNQFGAGHPTRSTLISPQVVIPDLKFMRPSIECPSDILVGRIAPELVWQIPKSYALDRTFTPYTFEVQVKGVERPTNRDYIKSETDPDRSSRHQSGSIGGEQIWRVLASGLKRNRLSLEHLDPEQEYWLRVVAVTQYGRGTPSQPVRKMADLNARRNRCASACIGVLHEPTPTSPTFTEPNTSVIYAPVYGHLDLKCTFRPVHSENETRFSWYFNGKLLDTDVNTAYPTLNQKFYSTVSKSGDTAILHLNGVGENDFGSYVCKAVHMMGTREKEFLVKMADAPVFLEVPTPILTVKLHSRFELPCFIDALPPPTIIWTRDSKRVVESHRTQIGKESKQSSNRKPSISTCEFSTDATLSVDKCIYQDAGLYTLVAENIAGRIMTSCLIHVEENPVPTNITLRWTNIEKHYFVLRRLEIDSSSEVRLLIDKKTNREYIGKLFNLDNPASRINGAREMECLMRLCHKNVLKLVDALISDNVLILVCEKLSGSDLLDSVLACENWSEMAAAAIIRSVLEALDHIHKQGVVHYDIQPNNLLFVKKTIGDNDYANSSDNPDLLRALSSLVTDVLSQTDRHKMNVFSNLLKVIGFSTAQTYITNSQNRMTCMPPIRYRPEYVSPEILLSIKKTDGTITDAVQGYCENLGPSADIWSLGVLTYILLAGWPPFVDYESGDILTDNILQAVIPFDIPEFENISDEGKDFIKQTLQADPTKRPSAKECLSHPWIEIFSNSENKSEYILKKLKKYKTFYDSVHPICIVSDDKNYGVDLRNRLATMVRQPTPSEDTESVLSSRSSSALGFQDNSESYSEDQSQILDRYGSRDFTDSMFLISSNPNIPTAADASESILEKFGLERQNTLTEATQLGETTYPLLEGQESISTNTEQGNQTTSASHGKIGNKFSAPVFASPLKDSYFNVHTREARFTCQLASAPYIPENIPGHEEALRELYPSSLNFGKISRSSSSAAAWYLGGCLLSDGPGVSLGAGHGGWLWLCLSDLRPEQDRSVVECVVRNRAGKSRTKARLLLGDTPKPPGRPGLIDVRPTEALISWLASTPDSNEDLIYRVDIKYSDHENEPPTWHRHGFTVDCRYLAINLKPGICYRVRISAGNTFGWGNYSIASSDFRTPLVSTDQSPNIFSVDERNWIFNWRQSANIYALSDHPVALQYAVDQASSVPPPPDKVLQRLHQHSGIIPSSDVLKSICKPIRLINKGTYTKLTLGKSHPMLSEGTNFNNIRQNSLSLPPRLLCKTTYLDPGDKTLLQKARREALILTILHGASGGMYSSFEDYFGEQDNSYLFTNRRQLLPSGWSYGWLADDAAKPTQGITVMQWIPGGRLIDVLCSRVEYTEFSVMMWCQQILMALRWFHTCFMGLPHGNVCLEHILVARRSSSLPDIVLSGFGKSTDSREPYNYFAAPELHEDQPKSTAADLWSVGAVIRLLLTGENPSDTGIHSKKPTSNESTEHHKSKVKTSQDSPSTIQSEENHTFPQSHISIKKLKRFSKPARKFVYNCLSPVPRKRGTVDFWLDSHWFDMNAENVNNLTSAIIPTNLLRSFKTTLDASVNSCAEEETRELQFS